MASPLLFRTPQCLSCLRQAAGGYGTTAALVQQTRGHKKLANILHKTNVIITGNSDAGRKGSLVSVTSGSMRNHLFPRGQAVYAIDSNVDEYGVKKVKSDHGNVSKKSTNQIKNSFEAGKERYFAEIQRKRKASQFNKKMQRRAIRRKEMLGLSHQPRNKSKSDASGSSPKVKPPKIEVELLSPEATASIIDAILPSTLEFFRQPNIEVPKKISPSLQSKAAIAAAAEAAKRSMKSEKIPIFGSVTISDVVDSMKDVLAKDEKGKSVVLTTEDIAFVELAESEEKDKLKHLGIFAVEVRLRGAPDVVKRMIKVSASA